MSFKISKYLNNNREAGGLFTRQTLKGGPIDPSEIVDAYISANRASYAVQKDMHNDIGYNYRLNNIQAAVGLAQLEKINFFFKKKN